LWNSKKIRSREITDEKTFLNRRIFIRSAALAGTVTAIGVGYRYLKSSSGEESFM